MTKLVTRKAVSLALRTHRVLNELTQEELCKRIESMSQSRLSRIEKEESDIRLVDLEALALAFEVDIQELLEDILRLGRRQNLAANQKAQDDATRDRAP